MHVHAYWRLAAPMHDLTAWSGFQLDLATAIKSDPAVHDPPRVMRLPGFTNHKRPAASCSIIEADPSRVYELAELHEHIPERSKAMERTAHATPVSQPGLDILGRATSPLPEMRRN